MFGVGRAGENEKASPPHTGLSTQQRWSYQDPRAGCRLITVTVICFPGRVVLMKGAEGQVKGAGGAWEQGSVHRVKVRHLLGFTRCPRERSA